MREPEVPGSVRSGIERSSHRSRAFLRCPVIMSIQATPQPGLDEPPSGQHAPKSRSGGWLRLFQGIRPVTRSGAARDALAGFQLAAMNIPQALGYTKIAGMPVVTGFYTLLLPLLAFAVFGSSRYLVVAADSATAAILAGKLAGMAAIASARYVALASTVALLTGGFLLLARVLKLGFLADFLSQTVLQGFSPEWDVRLASPCWAGCSAWKCTPAGRLDNSSRSSAA